MIKYRDDPKAWREQHKLKVQQRQDLLIKEEIFPPTYRDDTDLRLHGPQYIYMQPKSIKTPEQIESGVPGEGEAE